MSSAAAALGTTAPLRTLFTTPNHPTKLMSLSLLTSHPLLSLSSLSLSCNSHNPHFIHSYTHPSNTDNETDQQQQVIGDCLVFEDDIFDDPFLHQPQTSPLPTNTHKPIPKTQKKTHPKPAKSSEMEPQNLVPEQWKRVVEEINLSKKERRTIAKKLEFGQRKKKKRVDLEEYLRVKEEKLSQLNPLVLDNPDSLPCEEDGVGVGVALEVDCGKVSSERVEPKNPRWDVYGRGLDDITEFFNSGNYQPFVATHSQGRQQLFTREEKALMNSRIPKLAVATSQKWLPLHTLAASGEFYLLNTLFKYEFDINASDQDGLTALHKAVTCKKQAITNYLLRQSANPFVLDKDGASLLHYAVRTASSQGIKTLLLHNVDINLQDNDGWTPLHLAVQARRTDVVRLLLIKGADKTLKNQDGLTPLELCLYSGRDAKTYELIKLLKQLPRQRH